MLLLLTPAEKSKSSDFGKWRMEEERRYMAPVHVSNFSTACGMHHRHLIQVGQEDVDGLKVVPLLTR